MFASVDVDPASLSLGLQELLDLLDELLDPWLHVHWARAEMLANLPIQDRYHIMHTQSGCGHVRRSCWAPSLLAWCGFTGLAWVCKWNYCFACDDVDLVLIAYQPANDALLSGPMVDWRTVDEVRLLGRKSPDRER